MKTQFSLLTAILLMASLTAAPALAQDAETDDDLDVSVIESSDNAESAVSKIELPEEASDEARENAASGLETANEAREKGQEGRDTAREARENAAGQASEAANQAQEARNAGASAADTARDASNDAADNAKNAARD